MKKEKSVEQVLIKLNNMLLKRFGVEAEFLPIYGAPVEDKATVETVRRNSGAPMIVSHNSLVIPLRVDGTLVGAARVADIKDLAPRDLSQIRETIDLILTESLHARRRIEILAITEEILRGDRNNVIPFRQAATH